MSPTELIEELRAVQAHVGMAKLDQDGRWGPKTAAAIVKGLKDKGLKDRLWRWQISEHFTLGEFLKSETATARKLVNVPTAAQLMNLRALIYNVLEPVRRHWGPVRVTSGFRIWTPKSQHGQGEAADFEVTGVPNLRVARWIRDNLRFDQLILEAWSPNDPNAGWIHTSFRLASARKQVLRTPTGKAPYFPGLPV